MYERLSITEYNVNYLITTLGKASWEGWYPTPTVHVHLPWINKCWFYFAVHTYPSWAKQWWEALCLEWRQAVVRKLCCIVCCYNSKFKRRWGDEGTYLREALNWGALYLVFPKSWKKLVSLEELHNITLFSQSIHLLHKVGWKAMNQQIFTTVHYYGQFTVLD